MTVWNKGLTKETDERIRQACSKISKKHKGKKLTEEQKKKMIFFGKGNTYWKHPNCKPFKKGNSIGTETRFKKGHKQSNTGRTHWKTDMPEEIKIQLLVSARKAVRKKPNKLEKRLIYELVNTDFKYVGDSNYFIKTFNPDFIDKNNKKIIEVFGDYWHSLPNIKERDKKRIETYNEYGFKTLIIWEHEFKNMNDLTKKIEEFLIK